MKGYHQLSQEERYIITALSVSRVSKAEIARQLLRAPSTITRELARNRSNDDRYRAEVAHGKALTRRRRERWGSRFSAEQWQHVISLLKQRWSPEQIGNYLKLNGPFSISQETIYRYVLEDKRVGGSLYTHLRIMPKMRRKRYNSRDSRGILPGKRHISARLAPVETRRHLGHWEGDTLMGRDLYHGVLTLVERTSGLAIIRRLSSRTAPAVTQAALAAIGGLQADFRTITFDNSIEFHDYKTLEQHFPLKCYFATPYHSWERGSCENLNGLIRQYLPKGVSLRTITQAYCDYIAWKLNTRPRKRHGYRTPLEVYLEHSRSLHFKFEPKGPRFPCLQVSPDSTAVF